MTRTLFPATDSILSADALLEQILHLHFGTEITGCRLRSRTMNDVYWVERNNEPIRFLRVSRASWKSEAQLRYEVAVLKHLADRGAPVATIVPRVDIPSKDSQSLDRFYVRIPAFEGQRLAILLMPAPGQPFGWNTPDRFVYYGRALAKIHNALDDFAEPRHPETELTAEAIVSRTLAVLRTRLSGDRDTDWAYVNDLGERIVTRLAELTATGDLDSGVCHGDPMGDNAHITNSPEDAVTVFDFDCCGFGHRAYDLGVFRWSSWHSGLTEPPAWTPFLQGYHETRTRALSESDLAAIPVSVALRGLWILWYHVTNADFFGHAATNDFYFDRRLAFLRSWDAAYLTSAPSLVGPEQT